MKTTRPLRVGLAGAGMISRHHLVAWSRIRSADVVAICDPDFQRASDLAKAFSIPGVFRDVDAMLREDLVDILDIASPRETHAALVRTGTSRGLAVLCQKPLCPTLGEAESLLSGVPADARVMVHENWRFRPWYRHIAAWITEGRVGTVRQARMSMLGAGLLPGENGELPAVTRQPFFARERRLLVAESLIHHLDVLRWLLGPLRVIGARVAGTVAAVRGETLATALLETGDGAPVVLEGNLAVHGRPARARDRLLIVGDRGSIELEEDVLRVEGARPERVTVDLESGYQVSFNHAIAHFVDCVRNGTPFETAPADNLHTLALVEAVYQASVTGE